MIFSSAFRALHILNFAQDYHSIGSGVVIFQLQCLRCLCYERRTLWNVSLIKKDERRKLLSITLVSLISPPIWFSPFGLQPLPKWSRGVGENWPESIFVCTMSNLMLRQAIAHYHNPQQPDAQLHHGHHYSALLPHVCTWWWWSSRTSQRKTTAESYKLFKLNGHTNCLWEQTFSG